jgi:hypothetical protein
MSKKKVTVKQPQQNMVASIEMPDAGTHSERKGAKPKAIRRQSTAKRIAAGPDFVRINVRHHILKEKFPGKPFMWNIDRVFPYSQYGELLVDEPRLPYNIKACLEKAVIMKQLKIKYVVLKDGTIPLACTDDEIAQKEFGLESVRDKHGIFQDVEVEEQTA